MKFSFLISLLISASISACFSQTHKSKEVDIENFILQIFQQKESNLNYEDLYESLYQYYLNPVNINNTTEEELQNLHILTPLQLNSFFTYLKKAGPFISVYELQAINYFDMNTITLLLPFITVKVVNPDINKEIILSTLLHEENSQLIIRYSRFLEKKDAFLKERYVGNPDKFYMRFRSSRPQKYSVGFTAEKDAGETIGWTPKQNKYLADFLSGHLAIFNKKRIQALVIGDYQLQFGQGLVLGAGYSFGKGGETITTLKRNNIGIRPYTSVVEAGFFRGIAVTASINKILTVTSFYSSKRIDGNSVNADSINDSETSISSLQYSGYHRTLKEIEDREVLKEQSFGGNITMQLNHIKLGYTYLLSSYSGIIERAKLPYNLYAFTGHTNTVQGLNFSLPYKNFNFFGEFALSTGNRKAVVAGLLGSLSPKTDFSLLYRNYSPAFHSFFSNAFGENTSNNNEQGIYFGFKIKPFYRFTISVFVDRFKFPWLKFKTNAPSSGIETMLRLDYLPTKKIGVYAQMHIMEKSKNLKINNNSNIQSIVNTRKINTLIHFNYKNDDKVFFANRVQYSRYYYAGNFTEGFYSMVESGKEFRKFSASLRYALFFCDDYDNRQYAYEKDVLYNFSIPALSNKGTRFYILSHIKLTKAFDLWIKYSLTRYINRSSIGTGLEKIDGNKISEIKLQIRYKL